MVQTMALVIDAKVGNSIMVSLFLLLITVFRVYIYIKLMLDTIYQKYLYLFINREKNYHIK